MPLTKIIDGGMSAGAVLQVVQTVDTTAQSLSSSAGWNDLGTLSAAITPISTSSKILVSCQIGSFDHSQNSYVVFLKYLRDSTDVGVPATAGSRTLSTTGIRGTSSGDTNAINPIIMPQFLDSPSSTSALTYKVQYNNYNGSAFYYLRDANDSDSASYGRFIATLTLMEIAG